MDEWLRESESLTPPSRERLTDKIVSQIKEFIYSNKIKVGQKLPAERELARQLKVSRAVISDALRSLERAGLLEIRPGAMGGAFVTYDIYLPLFQTMHDLLKGGRLTMSHFCEARNAIESASVRLAMEKVTPRDIEHLRSLNRKLIDDLPSRGLKLRADNLAFHLAIAEIGRNPIIRLMVHSLLKLVDAMYPYVPNYKRFIMGQYERHEAIIDASRGP